ncbi:uncharacterized protein F5891DRAFT_512959 [Suillus fuscotomentosus]|uniref:Uncharacterized protein n=1 Tax=Suillus fuscotomentosus TaxID=1912939 RepID=A0AAD4E0W8_9AGAM|nr:uncharacterized protein F5891DRAFT_512959 [Suillus fuscotomentosus]KAG1897651.1 hypothetical protein F5891DRAFT_512959 [Suillus fuscotomentosus]
MACRVCGLVCTTIMLYTVQRPRFNPSNSSGVSDVHRLHHDVPSLCNSNSNPLHFRFQSLVSCPADVPLELFEAAVSQLTHHLEYNSTLILRSDTISDSDTTIPTPGRDSGLEQHCTLYAFETGEFAGLPSTLVLTPLVPKGEPALLSSYGVASCFPVHPFQHHHNFRFSFCTIGTAHYVNGDFI